MNTTLINTSLAPPTLTQTEGVYTFYNNTSPDAETIGKLWYYIVGVAGSFISVLGVICNILCLGVLASRPSRSHVDLYLIALAVYDLLYLLTNAVFVNMEHFHYGLTGLDDWMETFVEAASPITDFLFGVTSTASVYTTVFLSIDRVIAVVQPLKWTQICTGFRVKSALCVALLWSVILCVPYALLWKWETTTNPETNVTRLTSVQSSYSQTFFQTKVYLSYIYPIAGAAFPVCVLAIANITIAITMHRRHQMSKKITSSRHGDTKISRTTNKITAQVVFVSLFTLISRAMLVASEAIFAHNNTLHISRCPVYCSVTATLSDLFSNLNATVNFFCYFYFGEDFRRGFLKKYGCYRCYAGRKREVEGRTTEDRVSKF